MKSLPTCEKHLTHTKIVLQENKSKIIFFKPESSQHIKNQG